MSVPPIVLDSGVYAKLFLKEDDRADVLALLAFIGERRAPVFCPDVFLYEVLSIAAQNGIDLQGTLDLLRQFEASYLTLAPLTPAQLALAMRMAEDGHPKTGYPSIYDSAYHALAIALGGVFVTADKRHVAKAGRHGHVALLAEWRPALDGG